MLPEKVINLQKKSENLDSPGPKIKVDMRTEYRTEFLDSDKKSIPNYSKKLLQDWKYKNHLDNKENTPEEKKTSNKPKPETGEKKEKKIIYYKKSQKAVTDKKQQQQPELEILAENAQMSEYQQNLKQRRNLQQSKEKEKDPTALITQRPKNQGRNLEDSKEMPINNWAYMDWKPSAENPLPE